MNLTLEIEKFRSRTAAQNFLKFQRDDGLPMRGAQVRMRKYSDHKWANRRGNVAVIKLGNDPGGDRYLFADGFSRYEYQENTLELA